MSQLAEVKQRHQDEAAKLEHLENSLLECERQLKQARLQVDNVTDVTAEIDAQQRVVAVEAVLHRLRVQTDRQRVIVKIAADNVADMILRKQSDENTILDCEMALLKWIANKKADRLNAVISEVSALHDEMERESGAWQISKLLADARFPLYAALGDYNRLQSALATAKRGLERVG